MIRLSVVYQGGTGDGRGEDRHDPALYRVMPPVQSLVYRFKDHDRQGPPEDYLPVVCPRFVLEMAWAVWREVPGVSLGGVITLARRVREEGEVVLLRSTRPIAERFRGRFLERYHLRVRVEREGVREAGPSRSAGRGGAGPSGTRRRSIRSR